MPETFLISDPHFSHAAMLNFTRDDGSPMRPEFKTVEDMDAGIITRWNDVVGHRDTVYLLGDVTMKKRFLGIVRCLNGNKRLILGNHDIFGFAAYAPLFNQVYAMRMLNKCKLALSHIPIHVQSIKREWVNVHGHIHTKIVCEDGQMRDVGLLRQHHKYSNVCVEHHDYTPVPIDKILDTRREHKHDV